MNFFTILIFTFLALYIYTHFWRKFFKDNSTPSGFGVFLAYVTLVSVICSELSEEIFYIMVLISIGGSIYWLDDAITLSGTSRMTISCIIGASIPFLFFYWNSSISGIMLVILCLGSGLLNAVLTNIVNFYDGADLNLATFIIIINCLVMLFLPQESEWWLISSSSLGFMISFSLFNYRPNTIYFGDAGSFIFASLLTTMFVSFLFKPKSVPIEFVIPIALPTLDVFTVLYIRVKEKHDLLSRNYLHLYQRLNTNYSGFFYLLPQVLNTLLCLTITVLIRKLNLYSIPLIIFSVTIITIIFYSSSRLILLKNIKN